MMMMGVNITLTNAASAETPPEAAGTDWNALARDDEL